ncbi:uncharacterized protein [Periplaneta americana]|uniref:uncharacterized protein isoform X2 n=1 Tax=Periplaneta americana TaxID=6978 RepID=UPI0037E7F578
MCARSTDYPARSYGTLTPPLFILFVPPPAATTSNMIKMYSQRGKELTVVDGYKYRKYYKNKEEQKWRCIVKMCNAKIVTAVEGDILLNTEGNHNHEKDGTVHRQMITNAAKRKASEEDLFDRPSKLIRREICSAPQEISEKITTRDINLTKRNLYTQRRKLHPRLPKTTQEVHEALQVFNTESSNGEDLLLANNSENAANEEHVGGNTEDETISNDTSTVNEEILRSPPRKKTNLADEPCRKEAFNYMKTLTEKFSKRDDYSVYGEHIANRLRNSGRSKFEIAIAQHEIDNICFKLTMGAFAQQDPLSFSTEAVRSSSSPALPTQFTMSASPSPQYIL